jgi:hypothetical protein
MTRRAASARGDLAANARKEQRIKIKFQHAERTVAVT